MYIEYCFGEDGPSFNARGHVPLDEFMNEVALNVDSDDRILKETPVHCWTRVVRDFESGVMMYTEAVPGSRGAFKCTWVQAY
jgi:hypothetical protein